MPGAPPYLCVPEEQPGGMYPLSLQTYTKNDCGGSSAPSISPQQAKRLLGFAHPEVLYTSCMWQMIFITFQHSARNGCGLLAVHSARLRLLDHTVHLDILPAPMPVFRHTPALSSFLRVVKDIYE